MDHPDRSSVPGLYIHIPFCLRKCGYCGFYSVTDRTLIPDFLAALRREMGLLSRSRQRIRYGLYRRWNPLRSPPGRSRTADRQPSRGLHDHPYGRDHRRSQPGRHRSGIPAEDAGSRGEPHHRRLPVLRRGSARIPWPPPHGPAGVRSRRDVPRGGFRQHRHRSHLRHPRPARRRLARNPCGGHRPPARSSLLLPAHG